jgi:hypothetical protein
MISPAPMSQRARSKPFTPTSIKCKPRTLKLQARLATVERLVQQLQKERSSGRAPTETWGDEPARRLMARRPVLTPVKAGTRSLTL